MREAPADSPRGGRIFGAGKPYVPSFSSFSLSYFSLILICLLFLLFFSFSYFFSSFLSSLLISSFLFYYFFFSFSVFFAIFFVISFIVTSCSFFSFFFEVENGWIEEERLLRNKDKGAGGRGIEECVERKRGGKRGER